MNDTNSQNTSGDDPIITPTGQGGQLPTGLGEPIDTSVIKIPAHPDTQFDDAVFLELLSQSISLTKSEKLKIIAKIPELSQAQIDRLIDIFREEKAKFSQLEENHSAEISEIEMQKMSEWKDVESQKQEEEKRQSEAERIAKLQRKLQGHQ